MQRFGVVALVALLLSGCSLSGADDAGTPGSSGQSTTAQRLEQQMPADTQLITQKLTYMLNSSDKIYVLNMGDFTTQGAEYQNSGRYLQLQLATSLEQHGSTVVRQQGYFDPKLLTQEAQYNNCNLVMTARIERLVDNPMYAKEVSILINTYSANNGELLNSVLLNARAESLQTLFALQGSTVQQLINLYINALYQKVGRV